MSGAEFYQSFTRQRFVRTRRRPEHAKADGTLDLRDEADRYPIGATDQHTIESAAAARLDDEPQFVAMPVRVAGRADLERQLARPHAQVAELRGGEWHGTARDR